MNLFTIRARSWRLVAIACLLILATTQLSANAAVKAGAKCTKAGATSVSGGKKFTCVKSGTKLVWNKGVAIKAAPKPSLNPVFKPEEPTPTPSPTPSATPTPIPTPTPTPTIVRKPWEFTYLKIWDELEKAQNQASFPFEYKLSPTVNQDKVKESIAAYDKAMKIWMAVLDGAKLYPIVWTIMSEKDYTWWKQVVDQQEGTSANYAWNPTTNVLGHCQLSANVFCGYGNTFKSNTPDYKFLQYNVIGSSYFQAPNANTVNHEAVHFYQLGVVQSFPRDLPCWYVEGQASLYGGALQFNLITDRSNSIWQRDNFKSIVRQYQPNANAYAPKDWVDVLKNMYHPHISCSNQQDYFKYAVGMFAWEHLYEQYGSKVMHQVLLEFKAGKSFSDASQKQLGLTLDQLNEKLAVYLEDVFAKGN